ncbi:uncharacterized protein LOC117291400 [Asterias rubens]|uniref:uncharacterized protein LOC117291400 n=1 Tax=Asterias rubens TaxID=7604 RepID=UPI0014553F9D|nr:uncharacterized protein LOC117291400 [Asterias rubens]
MDPSSMLPLSRPGYQPKMRRRRWLSKSNPALMNNWTPYCQDRSGWAKQYLLEMLRAQHKTHGASCGWMHDRGMPQPGVPGSITRGLYGWSSGEQGLIEVRSLP